MGGLKGGADGGGDGGGWGRSVFVNWSVAMRVSTEAGLKVTMFATAEYFAPFYI